jgi:hypothetical protein
MERIALIGFSDFCFEGDWSVLDFRSINFTWQSGAREVYIKPTLKTTQNFN